MQTDSYAYPIKAWRLRRAIELSSVALLVILFGLISSILAKAGVPPNASSLIALASLLAASAVMALLIGRLLLTTQRFRFDDRRVVPFERSARMGIWWSIHSIEYRSVLSAFVLPATMRITGRWIWFLDQFGCCHLVLEETVGTNAFDAFLAQLCAKKIRISFVRILADNRKVDRALTGKLYGKTLPTILTRLDEDGTIEIGR